MPAYVLHYDRETERCTEVVIFPDGHEKAANWCTGKYEIELGEGFDVELIFAGSHEDILQTRWCVLNDRKHPVRFRPPTVEELALNSSEAFQEYTDNLKKE